MPRLKLRVRVKNLGWPDDVVTASDGIAADLVQQGHAVFLPDEPAAAPVEPEAEPEVAAVDDEEAKEEPEASAEPTRGRPKRR